MGKVEINLQITVTILQMILTYIKRSHILFVCFIKCQYGLLMWRFIGEASQMFAVF